MLTGAGGHEHTLIKVSRRHLDEWLRMLEYHGEQSLAW